MNDRKLKEYQQKCNPEKSGEPDGNTDNLSKEHEFVIQKHDASQLHYDFRLQVGDVLVSWAVPKGLSTATNEKRLAIQTENHPLDYAKFEGVIPEGEYGAGTVLVWDIGDYVPLTEDESHEKSMREALEEGALKFTLHGQKLKGGYAMARINSDNDKNQWVIFKLDDEEADARRNPVSTEPQGERTGFGALLLGYYEQDKLKFAGRVGTGFDEDWLEDLHNKMKKRRKDDSPIEQYDETEKNITWIEPELVAEVAFTEWTKNNRLRHPAFLGLRKDKNARDVHKEKADAS